MSNLKSRLIKLEESRTAKAGQQVTHVNSEETRQWLKDTVKSINDGTYVAEPKKPREPLPPHASFTKRWLYETLERLESENEQLK
jgi:hypothetical protein